MNSSDLHILGDLVRTHAVCVRAAMPQAQDAAEEKIRDVLRDNEPLFVLDPQYLPHPLVAVPDDEVWFVAGDGQILQCGPRTPRVTDREARWL